MSKIVKLEITEKEFSNYIKFKEKTAIAKIYDFNNQCYELLTESKVVENLNVRLKCKVETIDLYKERYLNECKETRIKDDSITKLIKEKTVFSQQNDIANKTIISLKNSLLRLQLIFCSFLMFEIIIFLLFKYNII
mgnify:CR=1 FL=1|tara:strand:- start:30600 stop:31007 length:408 start_codon:yes stop_codon:yes gene_type:complete